MKPIIPKTPEVPELTKDDIAFLTEITFGPKKAIKIVMLFLFLVVHIPDIGKKPFLLIKMAMLTKLLLQVDEA